MKKSIIGSIYLVLTLICSTSLTAQTDWATLSRYAAANKELAAQMPNENRVIFIGNSITQGWVSQDPNFFTSNNYIGRGIGGQTSSHLLIRFRQDVINLNPRAVVINIGTNDIAENGGTYDEALTFGNIQSMAELAQANNIQVILASVLPAYRFKWRENITDAASKIIRLNELIKAYADAKGFAYIDYHTPMKDDRNGLPEAYSADGVHPNLDAYRVMETIAKKVIDNVLSKAEAK